MRSGGMIQVYMRRSGQSLLEATWGLVIIVCVVVALVDLATVLYGVSLNDSTCRIAARAAAAGDMAGADDRAQVAIGRAQANESESIISHPRLILPVEVNLTSQPRARRDPESGRLFNPGGLVTGTITVKTQVEIRPFAMDCILRRAGPLIFQSHQTFPIHYTVPDS